MIVMTHENTIQLPPEASSSAHLQVLEDLHDRLAAVCDNGQQRCGDCALEGACSVVTSQTIEAMLRVAHDCNMALAREQRAQQPDSSTTSVVQFWIRGAMDALAYLLLSDETLEPAQLNRRGMACVPKKPLLMSGTHQDVSEMKQTEALLRDFAGSTIGYQASGSTSYPGVEPLAWRTALHGQNRL